MSPAGRAPIFATLDAMILAGWGETPQNEIPANWLECPPHSERVSSAYLSAVLDEIRQDDLARIEVDSLACSIKLVELSNYDQSGAHERAKQIFEILRQHRGRPRIVSRRRFAPGRGRRGGQFRKTLVYVGRRKSA